MFDSTQGISHIDQMSEVIRYVHISNGKVEVKEVFLFFFQLRGKKAEDLTSEILNKLKGDGLDIMLCRGQGYDNASTMASIHGGVQARIKDVNKKALFNGCGSHSLELLWEAFVRRKYFLCVIFWETPGAVFFLCCVHPSLGSPD